MFCKYRYFHIGTSLIPFLLSFTRSKSSVFRDRVSCFVVYLSEAHRQLKWVDWALIFEPDKLTPDFSSHLSILKLFGPFWTNQESAFLDSYGMDQPWICLPVQPISSPLCLWRCQPQLLMKSQQITVIWPKSSPVLQCHFFCISVTTGVNKIHQKHFLKAEHQMELKSQITRFLE